MNSLDSNFETPLDKARLAKHTAVDRWLSKKEAKVGADLSSSSSVSVPSPSPAPPLPTFPLPTSPRAPSLWVKPDTSHARPLGLRPTTLILRPNDLQRRRQRRTASENMWSVVVQSPMATIRVTMDPQWNVREAIERCSLKFPGDTTDHVLFAELDDHFLLLHDDLPVSVCGVGNNVSVAVDSSRGISFVSLKVFPRNSPESCQVV